MLRRILLALLTLCLALPAALPAATLTHADHPMAMSRSHTHQPASNHDQSDHAAKHQCIGCAVELDRSPLPMRRVALRPARVPSSVITGLPEARAGPETPPPRN